MMILGGDLLKDGRVTNRGVKDVNIFDPSFLMTGIGDYVSGLIKESFSMAPYGGPYESHLKNWTLYYWAWWIAWAPAGFWG